MTKEEKIKDIWIELIGEEEFNNIVIDVEGYLEVSHSDFHFKYDKSIVGKWSGKGYNPFARAGDEEENPSKLYVRPRLIENLNHNNGWKKIESEKDLPQDNDIRYHSGWFDNNKLTNYDIRNLTELKRQFTTFNSINVYQPIKNPKQPIY